jgi:hypothetical protein
MNMIWDVRILENPRASKLEDFDVLFVVLVVLYKYCQSSIVSAQVKQVTVLI